MLFDVLLLRQKGLRVPCDAGGLRLRTLRIREMDRVTNNFKRNILKAELWLAYGDTRMRGLAYLCDPVLLPYQGDGILIAGIERESADRGQKIREHRQVWLCSVAGGTEAEWERARDEERQGMVIDKEQ